MDTPDTRHEIYEVYVINFIECLEMDTIKKKGIKHIFTYSLIVLIGDQVSDLPFPPKKGGFRGV